jgi:predicted lipoprotein with Yx(FWY)xxD motif
MNHSRLWVSAIFLVSALVALTAWAPVPTHSEHSVEARVALQQGTPGAQGDSLAIGQSATLGSYLTDGQGMTVYMFAPDSSTTSACDATCAQT